MIDSPKTTIKDCKIIKLPKIKNRAGNITVVNKMKEIPFKVKRVFYLYDIPGGESRGAHSHKECHQFIIAASGSFSVVCDDGNKNNKYYLNQPDYGLHVPPGIWAHEEDFASGSICLVLASEMYNSGDYIRDYLNFTSYKR